MYSLLMEYWSEEILMEIGNILGKFVKVSEQTRQRRYTSYARICIYLDISKDLPNGIDLTWEDEDWFQAFDYEQIPFICKRCHKHGHLFRYFPHNKKPGGTREQENQDARGFIHVQNKKRSSKKSTGPKIFKKFQTQNRFESSKNLKDLTFQKWIQT